MSLDTLAYSEDLIRAGFAPDQAKAMVKAHMDHVVPEMATKGDIQAIHNRLDVLEERLLARFADMHAHNSKLAMGVVAGVLGGVGVLLKLFGA